MTTTRKMEPGATQVLIVSLILALFGTAFLVTRAGDGRVLACVQRYADAQSAAQAPRTDALERRDAALTSVVDAAGQLLLDTDARDGRMRLSEAIAEYQRLDRELAEARAQNPYPAPPTTLCKDRS